jgi:hypothetical protein
LATYRHFVWIAAEDLDVVADPLEGEDLVFETCVAGGVFGAGVEEAECAEAVVDGDEDDVLGDEVVGAVEEGVAVAELETCWWKKRDKKLLNRIDSTNLHHESKTSLEVAGGHQNPAASVCRR